MAKLISINPDNPAPEWWAAARASRDAPPEVKPLLDPNGPGRIVVTWEQSNRIVAWASALPGWESEDMYYPFVFKAVKG